MNTFILRMKKSTYINNIYQLAFGSLVAQIITILVAPIMTRLYTPEQIGVYTLMITLISVFGPIVSGKYEQGIMIAESEKEVNYLIVGSMLFGLVFLFIFTIGFNFYLNFNPVIAEEIGWGLHIVVIILFLTLIVNILNSYNNREQDYKLLMQTTINRSIGQNISIVLLGLISPSSFGLLISQVIGLLVGLKKQLTSLKNKYIIIRFENFKHIHKTLKFHKNLPIYSAPAHLINASAYSLMNFFIISLFGMAIFGFYALSYRILGLPLNLISTNVSKVFFQKASEEYRQNGKFSSTLIKMTVLLSCVSIPMVTVLIIFSPVLFELFFGEGWKIAGTFVQLLAPMYGIRLIVSSLSPALIITGRQKSEFIMSFLFICSSLISYLVCVFFELDVYFFFILISVSYSVVYIVFYIYIYILSTSKK